ncbi:MAG: diguanylate cyclase (GGDEF)-like protein [Flavobacteriales bacterium]|jgi:diguanylate cyclase (GGDEF)-like protein
MIPVLVVEDSKMVAKVIMHVLSTSTVLEPVYAASFAEARDCVENASEPFFAALVDLTLPDASDGEVVDYTLSENIPTIVLTSSFDEVRREKLLKKGIVDYVTKEGRYSYEFAMGTLHRLVKNSAIKVLVTDDSSVQRSIIVDLLRLHLYHVLEAEDGVEAIQVFLANPDTRLLITDYNMPRMDGFELIRNLRVKYEKTDLAIIGLSSDDENALSAKFIKHGANDFLKKPFNHEEFFCRISHNVELVELVEKIRDQANRDDLTGVYHRQYYFKYASQLIVRSQESNSPLAVAMLEIENFSDINLRFGNEGGDRILRQVAQNFEKIFDHFFVARAEGATFFVLFPGLDNEKAVAYVDKVRQIISSKKVDSGNGLIGVTYTAGVSNLHQGSIDAFTSAAVQCLKRAKEAGGDLVFGDDEGQV